MLISVIIPVYNAEEYVRQAVESAIAQPETGEVILIEDASPDNSLQVCQELVKEYSIVRLICHSDGKNHGAAASRNLGIKNSTFEYIALLDADDFYLPKRFQVAKELLESHPDVDGVYEAAGTYFHDEKAKEGWFWRNKPILTTVTETIDPNFLFESLLTRQVGYFHADGLLVRKKIFDQTGYFDEHFELRDDTVMWFKMAALSKLVPGRLAEPVSMRRVHSKNRISVSQEKFSYEGVLLWKTLLDWGSKNELNSQELNLLADKYNKQLYSLLKLSMKNLLLARKTFQIDLLVKVITEYLSIIRSKHLRRHAWQAIRQLKV
jgi:glycosyltransferase involved in cell wall biosynthesis